MRRAVLAAAIAAALSHCGEATTAPWVKGVGGACVARNDCAAGLSCARALGRGICLPPPRDGAVSLDPDASRPPGEVGARCDTASDCRGGLDCAEGVCALREGGEA